MPGCQLGLWSRWVPPQFSIQPRGPVTGQALDHVLSSGRSRLLCFMQGPCRLGGKWGSVGRNDEPRAARLAGSRATRSPGLPGSTTRSTPLFHTLLSAWRTDPQSVAGGL